MHSRTLIVTFFSGLLFAASVQAEDAIKTFGEMDTDASGYISMDEARASKDIADHFKSIDTDADGKLSIDEYQAYMGEGRNSPPQETETPEPGAAPY